MSHASLTASELPLYLDHAPNAGGFPSLEGERRSRFRYPIALDVLYRTVGEKRRIVGCGRTINISSSGVLLLADPAVRQNALMELSVDWPFLLDNEIPLQVHLRAKVVRASKGRIAVRIEHYEFRTVARRMKAGA